MNTIWYLIIFGMDWNTSQVIPQATQAECTEQARWVNNQMGQGLISMKHAICLRGMPR